MWNRFQYVNLYHLTSCTDEYINFILNIYSASGEIFVFQDISASLEEMFKFL